MTANPTDNNSLEKRVLVLMPTGRDATLVCETLGKAGIAAQVCCDAAELEEKIAHGGGAVLLAEEALQNGKLGRLIEAFDNQPIWSDVPVVIFASNSRNAEKMSATVGTRLNATIVERPIRITMLISAVRGALRAREKQYQTRDLLTQLEESDRQKDLFLATLSHELRTPLNSMLGWIRLLRGDSENKIDTNHALDVIERNARAQSEMISDILFVSRVITGKLNIKLDPIDLMAVLETAIDVIRPAFEAKEITLSTSFDANAVLVEGDFDRLQQVFWNLLSNAVKFTAPRGRISIRTSRRESNIEIEIKDNGQGIKLEFLPFVFERFRQADNSYTRQVGGLGLGLAIVRHLIELHGGTVRVASDGENRGASFFVSLPVSTKSPTETTNGNFKVQNMDFSKNDQLPEGVHLLLVEDDDDSREMLKVLFAQRGVTITAVASAAEAFDSIKIIRPDIMISDVGLPEEDGYQLLTRIRQLSPEEGGKTPAIALTGYASLQDRQRAIETGFEAHLAKPVDLDNLLALVRTLLLKNKEKR